jgi:hypothetical protein
MQLFNEKISFNLYFSAFALAFSLGAAYFDLKSRKIPNWYNLTGFGIALLVRLVLLFISFEYLKSGGLGFLTGFFILFPFFIFRLAGGGDIKLLAALGMILGFKGFLWVFVLTAIWDGAILFPLNWIWTFYLFLRLPFPLKEKFNNIVSHFKSLKRSSKKPYALPVFLACLSYIFLYLYANQFIIHYLGHKFDLRNNL